MRVLHKAPETIYTVVVNGGDLTVDGDIYFSSVSVVQNRVTSSATNIYVPDGSVVVNNAVRFWAQSDAHNAVGYNIYAGKSIILDANSYITSYCEYNPSSVNMSASEIKIGKGEITINIDESKSTPFTVEPSLVYNKDNYKIDVVFDDTGTKYIYNYIGSITPEDNGLGEDSGREAFPFTDVLPDDWFYEAVKYLYEHGVTNGTSDTTFSPGMDLTRGQFITLIMRAYGIEPDENPGDNFSDAGNTYYTGYLAAAKRLGISKGVGGNMFAPEKPLTRQEMCVLLYNLLNMLDKLPEQGGVSDASSFPDSNEVYDWASEAVSRFVSAGVITGSGGKLLPGGTTTRAQMAQVLYRLLSK